MAVELKTRGLPVEGLDPYIISVGKTQNLEVIQKIRQVCEPLIMELIQNHLKELKAYTGIFDFEVQITTNANRETEKLIEGKVQELELQKMRGGDCKFPENNLKEDEDSIPFQNVLQGE